MEMDDHMSLQLLYSWISSFEKAIINQHFGLSKIVIDEACEFAVDSWTDRLYKMGKIPEIKGREFQTIEECVHHHIDNLVLAGAFNESNRPFLEEDKSENNAEHNIVFINIPKCDYLEPCSQALDEHKYNGKNFPCQRVGCFVGAVKKYIKEDVIPENKLKDITYFMTSVHCEEGCKGVILVNQGFLLRALHDLHLENSELKCKEK